ncbi:MAG: thioesterase [Kiritimatiellaeota bacterium]|nr:thioesterase [Kiritimatiellota bacterium]
MARVKLELPESFLFSTEMPIRITDINYGGHLGNDAVLSITHEARVRFLAEHGYSEMDTCGAGMIQADAAVVYKSEAFYSDIVRVSVALADFTSSGCDFVFLLENAETGKEIARAKTGNVFYDYERKKPMRVPEPFAAKFK